VRIERSLGAVRAVTDGRREPGAAAPRRAGVRPLPRVRARLLARRTRRRFLHARPAQARAVGARAQARAGERGAVHDEIAETELRAPLAAWAERFFAQLVQRLERARATAELERFDLEERLLAPLEVLRSALEGT
jgi:hypothetical protein